MKYISVKEYEELDYEKLKDKLINAGVIRAGDIEKSNEYFNELVNLAEQFKFSYKTDVKYVYQVIKNQNKTYIKFQNFVGIIQLKSGLQIEILPKIYISENCKTKAKENLENTTKNILIKMICSLNNFSLITNINNISNLNVSNMNFYEIFINIFLKETEKLIKLGLKSSYIESEINSNTLKGKLIFSKHFRHNLITKNKFFISYDDYNLNRPENKLIKSALLKILTLSSNAMNHKICSLLLKRFQNIEKSINIDADFSKVVIDRTTKIYSNLLSWAKIFLKSKFISIFTGDNIVPNSFVLPMEELFEQYVGKYIKRIFNNTVYLQDQSKHLFKKYESNNEKDMFQLRPDIVFYITNNNQQKPIIMDTKWKVINNEADISRTDIYQMCAYSIGYQSKNLYLLYPKVSNNQGKIEYHYKKGDTTLTIFFIDLLNINESIEKLKSEVENKQPYFLKAQKI
ncbi:McrC family protein [Mycoplasmopsis primatum]|uniref:McrC family protein n=1 Tax=Mycoplasmopsis primatum TaxID=55604 RepID=UPI00068BEF80|nr:hypothetical protein [Mycoplasmopsis primatum]